MSLSPLHVPCFFLFQELLENLKRKSNQEELQTMSRKAGLRRTMSLSTMHSGETPESIQAAYSSNASLSAMTGRRSTGVQRDSGTNETLLPKSAAKRGGGGKRGTGKVGGKGRTQNWGGEKR